MTREQLLGLGLSKAGIAHRLQIGRLMRIHNGVYAVGHLVDNPVARAAAAVLACGPKAVLSHHSAAALWGFRKHRPGPIEVTAPSKHRRPGIKAHRATLARREITRQLGVRVSTPARTLLDIAASLTELQLIRAVNDALISQFMNEHDLDGTPLEGMGTERSRSPLEDEFKPWIAKYQLPKPQYNVILNGREADVYYPEARLIVELDGFGTHRTRAAFEDDRDRDAHMLSNGLVTIRITRWRLTRTPVEEAERLTAILDARWTATLTDF